MVDKTIDIFENYFHKTFTDFLHATTITNPLGEFTPEENL
jgi:hypothetical protein